MRVINVQDTNNIPIGKKGENNVTTVLFPFVKKWKELFGNGIFQLLFERPGESLSYAVNVTTDEENVRWIVTNTELAKNGVGKCELQYIVGDAVAKSQTFICVILDTIAEEGEEPPEPWQSWVDEVLEAGAAAQESAESAAESAEAAEAAKEAIETDLEDYVKNTDFATSSKGGVVKADHATSEDTQPVRIGEDHKLYTSTGVIDFNNLDNRPKYNGSAMTGETDIPEVKTDDWDGKYAKPSGGIPKTDLSDSVQASLALADSALQSESDPTVPSWAKQPNKPSYSASEITDGQTNVASEIAGINEKIPSSATSQNKLATASDVSSAVGAETTRATVKESNLQSQIDAIVSSSDVRDVVGTYSELLVYDTSTLGNNDIVKVLNDTTHGGARSYYRWIISGTSGTWNYIGSEAISYTKSEEDALLAGKQDAISDLAEIRSGAALGETAVQPEAGKGLFSGDYNDLNNKPTIPEELADLSQDTTHRTVTDAEKTEWSGKQDAISDLEDIRDGAELGSTAIQPTSTTGSYRQDVAVFDGHGKLRGSGLEAVDFMTWTEFEDTVQDIVADWYDDEGTYEVGDFCLYNDFVYRCIVDIPGGEGFNEDHWVNVKVCDELKKKADKVQNATNGHLAGLDSNGNLTDSGRSVSDIDTSLSQKLNKPASSAYHQIAGIDGNGNIVGGGVEYIDVAIKASNPTEGHIATLTEDGNTEDSGKSVDDFAPAPIIKTTMDSVAVEGATYLLGTQTAVSIYMPTDASLGQEIVVSFTSGATACTLTCDLTGFDFVPKANKTSWIKFTLYHKADTEVVSDTDKWLVETKEG